MLKFVLKYLLPYKVKFLLVMVCSILTASAELSTPYFTAKFIDEILVSKSFDTFYTFIIIIGFISIIAIIVNYIYIIESTKIQFIVVNDLIKYITRHIQRLSTEKLRNMDMVYMAKRIEQDSVDLISFILGSIIDISIHIVLLTTIVYLLFSIDILWLMAFIGIAILHALGYILFRKRLLKLSNNLREKESRFFSTLSDNYINVISIKLHSLYDEYIELFNKKYNEYYIAEIKRLKTSFWFIYTRFNSGKIFNLFVFLIGGYQVLKGNISVGNFVALNGYFMFAMDGIYFFMNIGQNYQNVLSAYNRILEIITQPTMENGDLKIKHISNISISNISYTIKGKTILPQTSFVFEKGKIYCIVGRNGTGKSTLINLLTGMYFPSTGKICFDDIDIKEINMVEVRKNLISIAEQNDFIPFGDIRAGINLDRNNSATEICELIEKFSDFIENSTEKTLSGGEKKKIAIIRAISKKAGLLILDEPDNNLDSSGLQLLTETLIKCKEKQIVIVVSHEPKIMEIADEIIMLGDTI